MTEAKDRIRADRAELLAALRDAGADVSRPTAMRCPFHDDRTPSAGIYQGDDGAWRFKCQASACGVSGDVFDIRAKVSGRKVEDELAAVREKDKPPVPRREARRFPSIDAFLHAHDHVADVYRYTNPDTGAIDLLKIRIEPPGEKKRFIQARIEGGIVIEAAPPAPYPLFNRTRVRQHGEVFVVEGEKCVKAVTAAGFCATCSSTGAGTGKAPLTDWTPLKGLTIFLWPDHDPVDAEGLRGGHEYMREVAEILKGLDCRLFWINPDKLGLNDKEDAADYLERFEPAGRPDALSDAMDIAVPMGASTELRQFLQDAIDGRRYAEPFPFPALSGLTKAIQPGCILMVCGEPGSAKSLFIVQSTTYWIRKAIKCAVFMLEDDRKFHLARVLAQVSKEAGLTDPEWVKQNPDATLAYADEHQILIDDVGRCMYDAPDSTPTYKQILAWLEQVTQGGAKIVVVDPITAVDAGKDPWNTDKDFLAKAKSILRRTMSTLILVTHPKNGASADKIPRLDQMSNSLAFPRFCQSVFWIRTHKSDRKRCVRQSLGNSYEYVDRFIHVCKARNGKGEGAKICFAFDKNSLTFREIGLDGGDVKEETADNL